MIPTKFRMETIKQINNPPILSRMVELGKDLVWDDSSVDYQVVEEELPDNVSTDVLEKSVEEVLQESLKENENVECESVAECTERVNECTGSPVESVPGELSGSESLLGETVHATPQPPDSSGSVESVEEQSPSVLPEGE